MKNPWTLNRGSPLAASKTILLHVFLNESTDQTNRRRIYVFEQKTVAPLEIMQRCSDQKWSKEIALKSETQLKQINMCTYLCTYIYIYIYIHICVHNNDNGIELLVQGTGCPSCTSEPSETSEREASSGRQPSEGRRTKCQQQQDTSVHASKSVVPE